MLNCSPDLPRIVSLKRTRWRDCYWGPEEEERNEEKDDHKVRRCNTGDICRVRALAQGDMSR
jgi:hypothetical protein